MAMVQYRQPDGDSSRSRILLYAVDRYLKEMYYSCSEDVLHLQALIRQAVFIGRSNDRWKMKTFAALVLIAAIIGVALQALGHNLSPSGRWA
jgi:hypothetical protein